MSLLLLSQPSTLCFRKPVFVRSSPIHSNNVFSSTSLPQTPPCVIMYVDPSGADPGKLVIRRAGDSTPLEKELPMELTNEMRPIGSSNGWLTTLKDGVMGLQDIDLNLVASDVDPKRISLPPLVTLPHCQTQIVTNVAMSSSSPEDEDCVVAVKFLGPQLSFFRPAQSNSEWINIRVENPCFFSSPVMYSKKDDMFRIPGSGGHLIASWDLTKHVNKPKFQSSFPDMYPNHVKILDVDETTIVNLAEQKWNWDWEEIQIEEDFENEGGDNENPDDATLSYLICWLHKLRSTSKKHKSMESVNDDDACGIKQILASPSKFIILNNRPVPECTGMTNSVKTRSMQLFDTGKGIKSKSRFLKCVA
ncbi:hypothetical protein ISN45_Aa08g024090 [Arabidopsis thaliana x Arabidopsis arenosa]|uniref:KIB1-4 beta-propeller domain-containing protein n=1 Tax=Arabidopsis thaliana x Arabidopsis arenosa TaxID=1240361 RepID=A0A8T1XK25_9BRAS|nr:hypothetical protein ISN45_Aa08g024090 [Arabidopsis thaliana x Arabidopsis arenosa]